MAFVFSQSLAASFRNLSAMTRQTSEVIFTQNANEIWQLCYKIEHYIAKKRRVDEMAQRASKKYSI